jgi:hypothetical protein
MADITVADTKPALGVRSFGGRRGVLRTALWTLAGIVVVGFAILVVGFFLLFHKPTLPAFKIDPVDGGRLEAKIKLAQEAAATAPQVLRVNEGEVNSYFDSKLALYHSASKLSAGGTGSTVRGTQATVKDLKFNLIEDRLHVYVVLDLQGKDMTVELEGKLRTDAGFIHFEPLGGKIGAIPIPRSVLAKALLGMMDSPETRGTMTLPLGISDLKVENGEFVVTYK